jgi:hypothetical protein
MINVTVRTNETATRSPAEVKRLLRDIGYALRLSQGIKLEMLAAREKSVRVETKAPGKIVATCAA